MTASSTLLEGLTEPQIQAVTTTRGPVLVLAGPGSGKTTVVTRRIARLLEQGVAPWSILALTFTNKAAGEMRQRVQAMVGAHEARGLIVSTFHAYGARMLRTHGARLGAPDDFSIFDTSDQRAAVKQAIVEAGLDTKNWPPATVLAAISHAKQVLCSVEDFEAQAGDFYGRSVAKVYSAYQRLLSRARGLDFDDLLRLLATGLRDDESLRSECGDRWRYLMVDEYQDTNQSQFIIASAIAEAHRNICVVGDPDQSIYAWRGADISNILDFESRYSDATVISLGQNFRSTGHIVDAAAGLIAHNDSHRARTLHTELGDGEQPILVCLMDEHEEAADLAERFRTLHDEAGIAWRDMAVLYRLNALSRVIEDVLRREEIPHVVARGTAFYDRKEVRDALSYLRVLLNPSDEVALRRIVNTPPRGIGKTTLNRVERFAARHDKTLFEAMCRANEVDGLSTRAVSAVGRFTAMVDQWRAGLAGVLVEPSLDDLVARVLDESGLESSLRAGRAEEDLDRLANIQELVSAAADREAELDDDAEDTSLRGRLAAWLERIALVSDADAVDPTQGAVTLMTLHAAKGLEFDAVAIAGCEQGILPHARAAADMDQMEEERRLCYVGMTRARKHLILARAMTRTQRGISERTMSSRFLEEIPIGSVRHITHDDTPSGATDIQLEVSPGQYVRHPRFGNGQVLRISRRGQGTIVTVDFEDWGHRTLPAAHAALEPVQPGHDW